MKKIVVSGFVVLTFVIYSFHQRSEQSHATFVQPAKSSGSRSPTTPAVTYKDGQYTGPASDAIYGYIQVKATVKGGKLTDVTFLEYPRDQHESMYINSQAMPLLKEQALKVQSAQVDGVSGATDTSQAFMQSLSSALESARA